MHKEVFFHFGKRYFNFRQPESRILHLLPVRFAYHNYYIYRHTLNQGPLKLVGSIGEGSRTRDGGEWLTLVHFFYLFIPLLSRCEYKLC